MPDASTGKRNDMRISVCIATYRRADRLRALLKDLTQQERLPDEVVVVDNDTFGTARPVIEALRVQGLPFELKYDIQPLKNISITRNRTVELSSGDWVAFVDDDERAPANWLSRLYAAAQRYEADGVLGPVVPVVPETAPGWIRRGHFYDWARMPTGTEIPRNRLRFGNVLLYGPWLRQNPMPFDPAYGQTGGEDGDLLSRLAEAGARLVWCDEAQVLEPVEPARLSLRWLMRRSLRGGQDFARHALAGRYGPLDGVGRAVLFTRAGVQAAVAGLLVVLLWPLGRHHAALWLTKVSANVGKLSVLWGMHYREYA